MHGAADVVLRVCSSSYYAVLVKRTNFLHVAARLARWLGPWTADTRAPRAVSRREVLVPAKRVGERAFSAWVYARSSPLGALFIAPGLHWMGPADPRLDRLCRVLAASGITTFCPFLPDYCEMRVRGTLNGDALRAYDAFAAMPEVPQRPPGVFSISFGSLPAIFIASRREIGGLVAFGGFADFEDTLRFCVSGRSRHAQTDAARPHDPLNAPVVILNFLEHLGARDPARVERALLRYVRRTWGRAHLKHERAFVPVALELLGEVAPADHALFLAATRVEDGAEALLSAGLQGRGGLDDLDPIPTARGIEAPTTIAHGRDDDVIPFEHAALLAGVIPGARALLTGAYAHTGSTPLREMLPNAADEGRAMVGIVAAMSHAALGTR